MARFRIQQAGRVDMARDTSGMSYTANLPAACAVCSRLIQTSERFTRGKVSGGGAATYLICRDCRPFTERESGWRPGQE